MDCPKCHYQLPAPQASCPHCGLIFAKYRKYHPEADAPADSETARPRITLTPPTETNNLFQEAPYNPAQFAARSLLFIGLVLWSWQFIGASITSNTAGESFLHNINLPFHEAGHIVFRPFGRFITSLGGTLGQLLMPSICTGVLLIKSRDPFGASVALWWVGENFLDIAPYVNDARAGQLPLVGGNFGHSAPYGFHDWQYLLTESGYLQYDHSLAQAAYAIGSLIMLTALCGGAALLWRQYRHRQGL